MALANSHPPPASYPHQQLPPQQIPQPTPVQQRPAQKTRKSRTFSFGSGKGSGTHKIDLHETSAEKEAKRLHSKADPTLAMQEAEPSEVAANVKTSLAPLRSIQHRDAYGNPIADPDRSNPTRNRWERPLDTIRSFEAAIDGDYSSRRSIIRPAADGEGNGWGPKRSSYYGGNGNSGRFAQDSYYGSRPPSIMYANRANGSQQDIRSGGTGQRDGYDQQSGYGGQGPPPQNNRRAWSRMASEPQYGSASRQPSSQDYPIPPLNHRSYETVASAAASGSSGEPAGYQTDPTSSDNSSIDRVHAIPRRQPEPMNDYGIGFSQSPASPPPAFSINVQPPTTNGGNGGFNNYQTNNNSYQSNGQQSNGYQSNGYPLNAYQSNGQQSNGSYQANGGYSHGNSPPPVPHKSPAPMLRKAMPSGQQQQQALRPAQPEKRKSWLARRFSKNA